MDLIKCLEDAFKNCLKKKKQKSKKNKSKMEVKMKFVLKYERKHGFRCQIPSLDHLHSYIFQHLEIQKRYSGQAMELY